MKELSVIFLLIAALAFFAGCESTDAGNSTVTGSGYYGVGFYDTWYYGDAYYPPGDIDCPPERPDSPPRPTHPIADPPRVAPRPMPSIPSTPRPSFRR
jgi:hypothetical protein